jgi:hypothetical protein
VVPNGQTTVYRFEYGPTAAYGSQTSDTPLGATVADERASARVSGLRQGGIYHYRLVATNDSATTVGQDRTFTAPVLGAVTRLRVRPSEFSAARRGPSARDAARHPVGARVSFRLNTAATVRFRAERRVTGRRVRGRCRPATRLNRGGRRCARFVKVRGSFTRSGPTGANAFRFSGRIRGKRLHAGGYRLVATPAGDGRAARAAFRIVR